MSLQPNHYHHQLLSSEKKRGPHPYYLGGLHLPSTRFTTDGSVTTDRGSADTSSFRNVQSSAAEAEGHRYFLNNRAIRSFDTGRGAGSTSHESKPLEVPTAPKTGVPVRSSGWHQNFPYAPNTSSVPHSMGTRATGDVGVLSGPERVLSYATSSGSPTNSTRNSAQPIEGGGMNRRGASSAGPSSSRSSNAPQGTISGLFSGPAKASVGGGAGPGGGGVEGGRSARIDMGSTAVRSVHQAVTTSTPVSNDRHGSGLNTSKSGPVRNFRDSYYSNVSLAAEGSRGSHHNLPTNTSRTSSYAYPNKDFETLDRDWERAETKQFFKITTNASHEPTPVMRTAGHQPQTSAMMGREGGLTSSYSYRLASVGSGGGGRGSAFVSSSTAAAARLDAFFSAASSKKDTAPTTNSNTSRHFEGGHSTIDTTNSSSYRCINSNGSVSSGSTSVYAVRRGTPSSSMVRKSVLISPSNQPRVFSPARGKRHDGEDGDEERSGEGIDHHLRRSPSPSSPPPHAHAPSPPQPQQSRSNSVFGSAQGGKSRSYSPSSTQVYLSETAGILLAAIVEEERRLVTMKKIRRREEEGGAKSADGTNASTRTSAHNRSGSDSGSSRGEGSDSCSAATTEDDEEERSVRSGTRSSSSSASVNNNRGEGTLPPPLDGHNNNDSRSQDARVMPTMGGVSSSISKADEQPSPVPVIDPVLTAMLAAVVAKRERENKKEKDADGRGKADTLHYNYSHQPEDRGNAEEEEEVVIKDTKGDEEEEVNTMHDATAIDKGTSSPTDLGRTKQPHAALTQSNNTANEPTHHAVSNKINSLTHASNADLVAPKAYYDRNAPVTSSRLPLHPRLLSAIVDRERMDREDIIVCAQNAWHRLVLLLIGLSELEDRPEPRCRSLIAQAEGRCRREIESRTVNHIGNLYGMYYGLTTRSIRGNYDADGDGAVHDVVDALDYVDDNHHASPPLPPPLRLPHRYRDALLIGSTPTARHSGVLTEAGWVARMVRLQQTFRLYGSPQTILIPSLSDNVNTNSKEEGSNSEDVSEDASILEQRQQGAANSASEVPSVDNTDLRDNCRKSKPTTSSSPPQEDDAEKIFLRMTNSRPSSQPGAQLHLDHHHHEANNDTNNSQSVEEHDESSEWEDVTTTTSNSEDGGESEYHDESPSHAAASGDGDGVAHAHADVSSADAHQQRSPSYQPPYASSSSSHYHHHHYDDRKGAHGLLSTNDTIHTEADDEEADSGGGGGGGEGPLFESCQSADLMTAEEIDEDDGDHAADTGNGHERASEAAHDEINDHHLVHENTREHIVKDPRGSVSGTVGGGGGQLHTSSSSKPNGYNDTKEDEEGEEDEEEEWEDYNDDDSDENDEHGTYRREGSVATVSTLNEANPKVSSSFLRMPRTLSNPQLDLRRPSPIVVPRSRTDSPVQVHKNNNTIDTVAIEAKKIAGAEGEHQNNMQDLLEEEDTHAHHEEPPQKENGIRSRLVQPPINGSPPLESPPSLPLPSTAARGEVEKNSEYGGETTNEHSEESSTPKERGLVQEVSRHQNGCPPRPRARRTRPQQRQESASATEEGDGAGEGSLGERDECDTPTSPYRAPTAAPTHRHDQVGGMTQSKGSEVIRESGELKGDAALDSFSMEAIPNSEEGTVHADATAVVERHAAAGSAAVLGTLSSLPEEPSGQSGSETKTEFTTLEGPNPNERKLLSLLPPLQRQAEATKGGGATSASLHNAAMTHGNTKQQSSYCSRANSTASVGNGVAPPRRRVSIFAALSRDTRHVSPHNHTHTTAYANTTNNNNATSSLVNTSSLMKSQQRPNTREGSVVLGGGGGGVTHAYGGGAYRQPQSPLHSSAVHASSYRAQTGGGGGADEGTPPVRSRSSTINNDESHHSYPQLQDGGKPLPTPSTSTSSGAHAPVPIPSSNALAAATPSSSFFLPLGHMNLAPNDSAQTRGQQQLPGGVAGPSSAENSNTNNRGAAAGAVLSTSFVSSQIPSLLASPRTRGGASTNTLAYKEIHGEEGDEAVQRTNSVTRGVEQIRRPPHHHHHMGRAAQHHRQGYSIGLGGVGLGDFGSVGDVPSSVLSE